MRIDSPTGLHAPVCCTTSRSSRRLCVESVEPTENVAWRDRDGQTLYVIRRDLEIVDVEKRSQECYA